jgi:phosphatidylethanolamine/phosphatidyl-N-methylethanolamine N-methyltransferase
MSPMGQRLADYRVFWRQFRNSYHTTGAVLPSGRGLSSALAHFVRHDDARSSSTPRRILEVGPGTGAVTAQIAHDMRPDDQLTLVERNEEFVRYLREQLSSQPAFDQARDRIELVHSSLEDLPDDEPYDLIISGLPLNNFSIELVDHLLAKMQKLLAPGGVLSFFEYVAIRRAKAIVSSRRGRERLRGIECVLAGLLGKFEIRRDLVLANVPPAWVHHVQLKAGRKASDSPLPAPRSTLS